MLGLLVAVLLLPLTGCIGGPYEPPESETRADNPLLQGNPEAWVDPQSPARRWVSANDGTALAQQLDAHLRLRPSAVPIPLDAAEATRQVRRVVEAAAREQRTPILLVDWSAAGAAELIDDPQRRATWLAAIAEAISDEIATVLIHPGPGASTPEAVADILDALDGPRTTRGLSVVANGSAGSDEDRRLLEELPDLSLVDVLLTNFRGELPVRDAAALARELAGEFWSEADRPFVLVDTSRNGNPAPSVGDGPFLTGDRDRTQRMQVEEPGMTETGFDPQLALRMLTRDAEGAEPGTDE